MQEAHDEGPLGIQVTSKDIASTLSLLSIWLPASEERLQSSVLKFYQHPSLPYKTVTGEVEYNSQWGIAIFLKNHDSKKKLSAKKINLRF